MGWAVVSARDDGGPAFPVPCNTDEVYTDPRTLYRGMSLRDWFAGTMQEDDRLVKCIRVMDDSALEIFALHPTLERDENITEVELTEWMVLPSQVAKVARRLELEARAIARVRYMQADAMLEERSK